MRVPRTTRWFALAVVVAFVIAPVVWAQEMGRFRTRVSPHVAGVFIEGKYYGNASMFASADRAITLKPGVYNVELVDPRYETLNVRVTIEAGEVSTLRRRMTPAMYEVGGPLGELRVDDFENAAVYLNGKYYGNSDEFQTFGSVLLIKAGKYHLKVAPADGSPGREADIEIQPDMTLVVGQEKPSSYER